MYISMKIIVLLLFIFLLCCKKEEGGLFITTEERIFVGKPSIRLNMIEEEKLSYIIQKGKERAREMAEYNAIPKGEILSANFVIQIQLIAKNEQYNFDNRMRFRNKSIFLDQEEKKWIKSIFLKYDLWGRTLGSAH